MIQPLATPHPDPDAVRRLFGGSADPDTAELLWRHLREGCASCRRQVVRHLAAAPARMPAGYETAFGRSFRRLQDQARRRQAERREARERAERLVELPAEQQSLLIANLPAFRTWGLAERLLQLSEERLWEPDRRTSRHAVLAAVGVAGALEPARYGIQATRDLRARAWAALGNQHRIFEQIAPAEAAFQRAEDLLRMGAGDPIHRVELSSLRASLLNEQGRWAEMVEVIDGGLAQLPPEASLLRGQLLVKRAHALDHSRPEEALRDYTTALVDVPAHGVLLRAIIRLGRARTFVVVGRPELAERDLLVARGILRSLDNPIGEILTVWAEGTLLRHQDHPDAARCFRRVWSSPIKEPMPSRLPVLGLEWIDADLAVGRTTEARSTVERIGRAMERAAAPTWVLRDWAEIGRAVADGSFPRRAVDRLVDHFWRAWYDPGIRLDLAA